jgi:hypothetical protein
MLPPGGSTLSTSYDSRSTTRTLGWITLVASVAAGIAISIPALGEDGNSNYALAGLGVGVVGGYLGVLLIGTDDEIRTSVTPSVEGRSR